MSIEINATCEVAKTFRMSAGTCRHCRAWLWHREICFNCGGRQ